MEYNIQQASNWEGVSMNIIKLLEKNDFTLKYNSKIRTKTQQKYSWEKNKDIKIKTKYCTHCSITINTLEEFNKFCSILQENKLGSIIVYPTYLLIYDDYIE